MKIKRFPNTKYNIFAYLYFLKKRKYLDILITFHVRPYNLLFARYIKLINSRTLIYIKADENSGNIKYLNSLYKRHTNASLGSFNNLRLKKNKAIYHQLKYIDIISYESIESINIINEEGIYGCIYNGELFHIENGVSDEVLEFQENIFEDKENIILHVARIGTFEKNTEFFLDLVSRVDLKDFSVIIIGSIEEDFQRYLKDYFIENPILRKKVKFLGEINDRKQLYNLYAKSKIFILTSRYEGYPNVFPEALYFGNVILTTNVGGAFEITQNNLYGYVFKQGDIDSFSQVLNNLITSKNKIDILSFKTFTHRNNLLWTNRIKKISIYLHDKFN